jgi:hypothetical protein
VLIAVELEEDDEVAVESSVELAGGDADEDDVAEDPDVPEVLFCDDPGVAARLSLTGFVWNESRRPSPAAVPAMTKGARLIDPPRRALNDAL